jgi:hypothetical protein
MFSVLVFTAFLIALAPAPALAENGTIGASNGDTESSQHYWTKKRLESARPMYQSPGKGFAPQPLPGPPPAGAPTGGAGSPGTIQSVAPH